MYYMSLGGYMIGLILLSLLGSAAIGTLIYEIVDEIDDDDDNNAYRPQRVSDDQDNDDGEGDDEGDDDDADSDTLTGTNGNDNIRIGPEDEPIPSVIDLLAGDDTARIDVPFGLSVYGGDGDDTLSSTVVSNSLYGGNGDDTLTGIDGVGMSGGPGDDLITFDSSQEIHDATAIIHGGEGEDTINIMADVGIDTPDRGGTIASGGEGRNDFDDERDVFNVTLDLKSSTEDLDGSGEIHTRVGTIAGFDPEVDDLRVELIRDTDSEGREVEDVSFTQTEDDGVYTAEIVFTFAATEAADTATASLQIRSNTPFEMEDIEFIGI